ncbi:efflux transporter periplasmic adaptor subunit [Pluralibacter gergoviae]|uniref:efflux RND transporter periplasmic adaptor subunit n=1 Tax=Pluralibacter gergoviae TaxID=61647 RepID=UPI0008DC084D|nr:efflux RND transporter periplasmic adaptor subunit [Pluralibacter gergoviae]OHY62551.1 efflux transporter periplasmic adaptor subunit [Pluralibacter gergoviae]
MKRPIPIAVAVAVLAAAAGYYAGTRHHADAPQAESAGRKVLYWYDPMVPGQRFDKPGKSPFMDMQLVPRYADEQPQQAAGVAISASQQQSLGMVVKAVQRRALSQKIAAWGTITQDDRSLTTVPAPAAGVVEKLFVRAEQQQVRAGEPLAQLWIPAWTSAQQEYLAVRQLGDPALTRAARGRLALQFMPEATLRQLERSGSPQTRITLRAPRDGYVAKLDTREGVQVAASAPLFELANLDPVWLVVDYPQSQAGALAAGAEIQAATDIWPGETFRGRVSEILPQMDAATRTLKARIVLDNPQHKLRPGMYMRVAAQQAQGAPAVLAVPEEAVIATGERSRVIVARDGGRFEAVNVMTGISADGWTEIRRGLQEGERVVTSGQFLIDSEASLRSALPVSMEHEHGEMQP